MGGDHQVPFLDLACLHARLRAELQKALESCIDESAFVGADYCAGFERAFAEACRARYCVGCSSGTSAITIAIKALFPGGCPTVVVPAMAPMPVAGAVLAAGARLVVADVEDATLMLDWRAFLQSGVAADAVVCVDLYGNPFPREGLKALKDAGLKVIEDASHAHLAYVDGRPVGRDADATVFSFYPSKNLGALGDAGAVLTEDEGVYERLALLRNHGYADPWVSVIPGENARMDALQARFLMAKLPFVASWNAERVENALYYLERLEGCELVRPVPLLPGSVAHLFVVRVAGRKRDALRVRLDELGIGTGLHYPVALSSQPALAGLAQPCPVAEEAAGQVLSLPVYPGLPDSARRRVAEAVLAAAEDLTRHEEPLGSN
jgi:dTDP-4-amino-4,6-dideoxygalactose transaminase